MKLNNLPKVKLRDKKRIGRGIGSGKGKTSARGSKGQKARGRIPAAFIGGGLAMYRKLPYLRGWGNAKASLSPVIITLSDLNRFKAKSLINVSSLIASGLVKAKEVKKRGVKILSRGELKISLDVELPVSDTAKQKIERAGGKVSL